MRRNSFLSKSEIDNELFPKTKMVEGHRVSHILLSGSQIWLEEIVSDRMTIAYDGGYIKSDNIQNILTTNGLDRDENSNSKTLETRGCVTSSSSSDHLYSAKSVSSKQPANSFSSKVLKPETRQAASASYTCDICNRSFSNVQNRKRHIRTFNHSNLSSNLVCSECSSSFPTRKMFMNHLSKKHPEISLKTEHFVFKTSEEFDKWKLNIEKVSGLFYWKQTTYKTNTSKTQIYVCHRSGKFISKGAGIRRLKKEGSNKCGFFCPARIVKEMFLDPNGKTTSLNVKFLSTHIGHKCDESKLILTTKKKKKRLCKQMIADVTVKQIHNNIPQTPSQDQFDIMLENFGTFQEEDNNSECFVPSICDVSKNCNIKNITADPHLCDLKCRVCPKKMCSNITKHNPDESDTVTDILCKALYSGDINKLQEEARVAVSVFLSRLNKPMCEKSLREIIHTMHILAEKCDAFEVSQKTL